MRRTMPTAQRKEVPRNPDAVSVEYMIILPAVVVFTACMMYMYLTHQLDLEFLGLYDWSTVNQ